jgi:LuxR family transcriptional regulator, quorum-sensing system regulator CviR
MIMHDIETIISKKDALTLIEIINECSLCATTQDAFAVMQKTNTLLDFDKAVYGLATINKDGSIVHYDTINFSYPIEWLDIYKSKKFHEKDPIALENFCNFDLQYWADTYKRYTVDKEFISMSEEFDLLNGYACGTFHKHNTEASLLSLAGDFIKHPRNDYILTNLSSHLLVGFSNVLHTQKINKSLLLISVREKEVLNWVKFGKSTWDISMILKISERTVKFHIDNSMRKLNAMNRTHAVAIGLSVGVLDFN